MQITREMAVSTIKKAIAVVRQWEASDAPNVKRRSGVVKQMSNAVAIALDKVCLLSTYGDVEDQAKELILAVDRFQTEVHAWREAVEVSPESVHPAGTSELWAAFKALELHLEVKRVRLPEPIRELMDAGVGDQQICKIYGFVHDDGSADVVKLAEEKSQPGTHYNPATWRPRREASALRESQERWARRAPVDHIPIGMSDNEVPRPRRMAPESLDELIAQSVSGEQIAKMKGTTVEEVEDYVIKNGLPLEGRLRPAKQAGHDEQAAVNKRRAELIPRSHPEISDMEDRILACAVDGMKPTEIAESLQLDFPALNWQKVAAVIRKLEKEAETVASEPNL